MRSNRRRSILALALACSLLAACSSPAEGPATAEGDKSRVGKQEREQERAERKAKANKNKKRGGRREASRGGKRGSEAIAPAPGESPPSGQSGTTTPESFASQGPPSPVDPSLARHSSTIDDPANDAEKQGALVPPYAELTRAVFQGRGKQFEIRLSFNGSVPERMPDKETVMVVGVGISAGGNDTYGFTAQATPEGWKAYAGAKDGAKKFPGQFLIDNGEILMRVPWRFINGPREFRWQVNSTWFKSVANTSHYSFDMAPNKESAQFPD